MRRYRFLLSGLIFGCIILFLSACQVQPGRFIAEVDPHESIEPISETFDATCSDFFAEDKRWSTETTAPIANPDASAKPSAADVDSSDGSVKAVTSSKGDPTKDTTKKSTRQPDSSKTTESDQESIETTKSTATTAKTTTILETTLESTTFVEKTTVTAQTKPSPSPKPTVTPTPVPGSDPPITDAQMAKEIFKYLSQYRVENGLAAFKEGEPKMWEAAQIRAHEIVIEFDHWRPNNRSWSDVLWEVGINENYTKMGECVCYKLKVP